MNPLTTATILLMANFNVTNSSTENQMNLMPFLSPVNTGNYIQITDQSNKTFDLQLEIDNQKFELLVNLSEILINQSVDIDKETNDLINQNFWNLL